MARKRKKRLRRWRRILIALLLIYVAHEIRFWIPQRIRPPEGVSPVSVELKTTAYCHCRRCCSYFGYGPLSFQKVGLFRFRRKHVGKTSSGAMVRPGTLAADTTIYPYGTIMYIPGYGYGRVEDTGGAIKGQHIDLYRPNHWFAWLWGAQPTQVKVWLPKENPGKSPNDETSKPEGSQNPPLKTS